LNAKTHYATLNQVLKYDPDFSHSATLISTRVIGALVEDNIQSERKNVTNPTKKIVIKSSKRAKN
jgi:hypothetical protein